uniref:C-type lectin domain-containing protein n=1 Tax=Amphiprion percula TaxID=161767 RepID=A0A3P8RWA7_AMPPE
FNVCGTFFQLMQCNRRLLLVDSLSVQSTNLIREYHYVKILKNWTDAQRYCREMFTDLATVENQYDNKRLLSVIQNPKQWTYIGLYDDLIRWKWVLGNADFNNKLDFSNWRSNDPYTGRWWDVQCYMKRYFICQSVFKNF